MISRLRQIAVQFTPSHGDDVIFDELWSRPVQWQDHVNGPPFVAGPLSVRSIIRRGKGDNLLV